MISYSENELPESDSSDFIELFAAAKVGSKEQQAELLNSFRDYLRVIATTAVDAKSNAKLSVSDLVQSAIIDACNTFGQCRATGKEEFKGWLRQILLNDILNQVRFLRRQKRDIGRETDLDADQVEASTFDSPVALAQRNEEERLLIEAVEQLLPDQQMVIRMRHRDKQTFVEIGKRMNRTADAARMLWNRAVEELSRKLRR